MKRTYTIHATQHVTEAATLGSILGAEKPAAHTRVLMIDDLGWPHVATLPGTWTMKQLLFMEEQLTEPAEIPGTEVPGTPAPPWTMPWNKASLAIEAVRQIRAWIRKPGTADGCCELSRNRVD